MIEFFIRWFAQQGIPLKIEQWNSPYCFMQVACDDEQPLPLIFIGDACRECWMLQQQWKREDEIYEHSLNR